jgi:DUF438 domain-containing protein
VGGNLSIQHFAKASPEWASLAGSWVRVLIALSADSDSDGECFTGISKIIERTNMSETHVYRAIRQLVHHGWLVREIREGRTYYKVRLTKMVTSDQNVQKEVTKMVSATDQNGQSVIRRREQTNEQTINHTCTDYNSEMKITNITRGSGKEIPPKTIKQKQDNSRKQVEGLQDFIGQKTGTFPTNAGKDRSILKELLTRYSYDQMLDLIVETLKHKDKYAFMDDKKFGAVQIQYYERFHYDPDKPKQKTVEELLGY